MELVFNQEHQTKSFWICRSRSRFRSRSPLSLPLPSNTVPDDMGLDTIVELALANMDLNDPVLEPVRFDDLEGSASIPADAKATMDTGEEEDVEESSGDHDDGDSDADSDADWCLEACIPVVVLYFLFLFAIGIAPTLPM